MLLMVLAELEEVEELDRQHPYAAAARHQTSSPSSCQMLLLVCLQAHAMVCLTHTFGSFWSPGFHKVAQFDYPAGIPSLSE
jgi:hypothetical protein